MVKKIIDIEVNDESFKRFMAIFAKYEEAMKKMPENWEKSAKKTNELNRTFEGVTNAVRAHAAVEKQLTQEKLKQQRAEKEVSKEQKKSDAAHMAAQKKALDTTKKIASSIASTTANLMKWVSIGALAELGTDFLGFWGLKALASSVGNQRRLSMGLGTTIGEQKAMEINFGRYVDTNGLMEKVANAAQDPSQWWLFNSLGVRTQGRTTAQMSIDTQRAVMGATQNIDPAMLGAMAKAYGWDQIFSLDEIRALKKLGSTSEGRAEFETQARKYEKDRFALNIQDTAARKWQDFVAQLDRGTEKFRVAFIDKLTTLEPKLEFITQKILAIAGTLLSHLDETKLEGFLNKFAGWLDKFGEYLGSDKFSQDIQNFTTAFGALVQWVTDRLVQLHIIPDYNYGPGGKYDTPEGTVAYSLPKRKNLPAGFEQKALIDYTKLFMSMGLSKTLAAGLAVQVNDESSFDPFAVGDQGTAYGLFQWHKDRYIKNGVDLYKKLFGHTMKSVTDPGQAAMEQVKFAFWEMNNTEKMNTSGIKNMSGDSPYNAGYDWSYYFERAGKTLTDRYREASRRGKQTEVLIQILPKTGADYTASANAASR